MRSSAPLGAGGMGEVYRARDTRLNRDVAMKVLPDAFAHDPDRLARFSARRRCSPRSTIQHRRDLRSRRQPTASARLVMELVEGPTLADRIAQGPLPLDEALPIARRSPRHSKPRTSRGSSIAT